MSSQAREAASKRRWLSRALTTRRALVLTLAAFVAVRLLVLVVLLVVAQEQGRSAYRVLVKWDAQWYRGIAENGYGFTRPWKGHLLSDYAFFPLFPGLERAVAMVTGLAAVDAGLLVSAVSSVAAAWGIFAVATRVRGPRVGFITTVLWAALPFAAVESMAYSESLFTALAAWALYATLRERWLLAGVLACFAGLTRPVGAAVVAAVVVPAVVHHLRRGRTPSRRDLRPLVGALVAPLGWFGYVAWVGLRVGSPVGYLHVASGWGNGFDGGVAFAHWTGALLTGPTPVLGCLVVLGVALVVWLLVLCVRQRQPLPLLVFAGLLVFLALTTAGYFGSKPRYLLPAFPLLLPLAQAMARRRPALWVSLLVGLSAAAAAYGAVWLLGPGPP